MTTDTGVDDLGGVRPCHAPWLDLPDVVAEVQALVDEFSGPDVCVADALCDRHAPDTVAFHLVDVDLGHRDLTFAALGDRSRRLAAGLAGKGVTAGDRVGVLMAKTGQLPVVALALWRLGAVYVPLFTAFAGPAIEMRLHAAEARLVIADPNQVAKLAGVQPPVLESGDPIEALIASNEPIPESVAIGGDGVFVQLYTSGTTGAPKGVPVPAFAIGAFTAYMRYGFDVRAGDVFWNGADPGWAYGLYYALIGPLAIGAANVLHAGAFSADATARIVDTLGVNNFATAPTVYRALKKQGVRFAQPLRVASSAGEPLTPDVTSWAPDALGSQVRDQWGQTEQGMAIVNAWDDRLKRDVAPGSMGQALPGFMAGTVDGTIALSVADSPLMWFEAYVNDPERTRERYTDDGAWYLSGDVGRHDGENFFFASRDDDVILASGYRISPFDLESIMAGDDAVSEVAVVGRRLSGEVSGEVIQAFVTLHPGADRVDLEHRLQDRVRAEYGAHAYPRKVFVVEALPKTPSGKVRRVELRDLSEADIADISVDP